MSTLSVQPGEIRARANELEVLRQQQLEIMKRLRILVMSLSDNWKGEAQDAFVQKFLSRNKDMNDLSDVLRQYITLAQQTADRAEAIDDELLRVIYQKLG